MNNKPYSSQSILNSIYDPETQSLRITRDMPNGNYAPKEHTHVIGDVINLQNELDSKAEVDHNHDEQYLSLSGGSMTGTLHADSPVFTGDISEGGMLLSEKYAAKEHSHNEKADKASTLAGYGIMDAYTKSETDAKISSVYRYRGSVETYADLPTEGQKEGDVWNVASADTAHGIDAGDNVAWTADGEWDALSGQVDLTPFALKTDAATDHNHDETYIKTSGETVVATKNFAIKAAYSDNTASTRTGYVIGLNGSTIQIGGNGNCDRITLSTAGFELYFYNYDKSIIVKDTSVNKTYFSFKGGDLNVSSSLSEAGTKLSDKYAAKSHIHEIADVNGLNGMLHSYAVAYAETLPMASENAPGCVIVTGDTTDKQTTGHVYALTASTGGAVRNLSITVVGDSRMTGTYLYHGLFRGSHSWVSSSLVDYAGTGGNTGNIVLWRGSDNGYWYFTDKNNPALETVGALYTRHDTDNPLDITETEWSDGESGTLTVTIADGGEGHPALSFTSEALGKTIALYRKGTHNGRPRWESQDTVTGNFMYELVWHMSSWMLRNPVNDTCPESIVSDAASPLELSGQTWTSVCTLEEVSPASGETSYAYKDITVAELDALRAAVAALEARVTALEA